MRTLHVLNGDAMLESFQNARLAHSLDVVIWREILSEGPVKSNIYSNEELWSIRQLWLEEKYGSNQKNSSNSYDQKVVAEFDKLARHAECDSVVFWFEHDLFCQINLVFLLACFSVVELEATKIKLVSIHEHSEHPEFKGLGELNGEQLSRLYRQAEEIGHPELAVAAKVWKAYASTNPLAVHELLQEDFGRLRYLKDALMLHLGRFPAIDTGLNEIEKRLMDMLLHNSLLKEELVGRFLKQDRVYGISDWTVEQIIGELDGSVLRRLNGRVELTQEGTDTLAGRRKYCPVDRWLGGYYQTADSPYRYSSNLGLVRVIK